MMPLIAVFVNHDGKIETTPESFSETMKKVYEAGIEDGKNKALAEIYREQWMPYKYLTYPISVPTGTGTGGDPAWWQGVDITCDTSKYTGDNK